MKLIDYSIIEDPSSCILFIRQQYLNQSDRQSDLWNDEGQSLAGQVIIKVNMYGRYVLLLGRNLQLLVQFRLVLNPIIDQSRIHVQNLTLPLPGVTLRMHVDLLITVQDLPDSLLSRHLKLVLSIAESIDDSDELTLLGEFADEELLVFPPGDGKRVSNELKMQVPPLGDIELLLALGVDEGAWLFGLLIKPGGDISACCLDNGVYLWQMPALLDQLCEVVDIIEEGDPYVVGCVMGLQL